MTVTTETLMEGMSATEGIPTDTAIVSTPDDQAEATPSAEVGGVTAEAEGETTETSHGQENLRDLLVECRPKTYVDLFTVVGFHLQNRRGSSGETGETWFSRQEVFDAWKQAGVPMPSTPVTAATRASKVGFVEQVGRRPAARSDRGATPLYRVTDKGNAALRAKFHTSEDGRGSVIAELCDWLVIQAGRRTR